MGSAWTVTGGDITASEADYPLELDETKDDQWHQLLIEKWRSFGKTCRKTCPLTPEFTGTSVQWPEAGAIEQLMSVLHGQVREQVKKKPNGQRWWLDLLQK